MAAKKKVSKKKTVAKKKASAKKTTTKKSSKKKTAAKKAVKKNQENPNPLSISDEERWKMVAVAAFHKAEKRGFAPGYEVQDWVDAEKEIDALLFGKKS